MSGNSTCPGCNSGLGIEMVAFALMAIPSAILLWHHNAWVADDRGRSRHWAWVGVGLLAGGCVLGYWWAFHVEYGVTDWGEAIGSVVARLLTAVATGAVLAEVLMRGLPRRRPRYETRTVEELTPATTARHEPCRSCGQVILVGAAACPFCGVDDPHSR